MNKSDKLDRGVVTMKIIDGYLHGEKFVIFNKYGYRCSTLTYVNLWELFTKRETFVVRFDFLRRGVSFDGDEFILLVPGFGNGEILRDYLLENGCKIDWV